MSKRELPFDQPLALMQKTVELLKTKDLIQVSAETRISFYWLRRFLSGGFKNPSVNRVEYLYEHLSGTKLFN